MTEQPSADDRRPPGLTDDQWSALLNGGGAICRGRQYEDDDPVYEIRWPNGATTDLRRTTPLRPLASGGLVQCDAATAITFERSCWADRPAPGPSPEGVTISMDLSSVSPQLAQEAIADLLRRDVRGGRKPEVS